MMNYLLPNNNVELTVLTHILLSASSDTTNLIHDDSEFS